MHVSQLVQQIKLETLAWGFWLKNQNHTRCRGTHPNHEKAAVKKRDDLLRETVKNYGKMDIMTYLKAIANNRPFEFEMETVETVLVQDPDVHDPDAEEPIDVSDSDDELFKWFYEDPNSNY